MGKIRIKLAEILPEPTDGAGLASAIVEECLVRSCQYTEHKGSPHSLLIEFPDKWDDGRISEVRSKARRIASGFREIPPSVAPTIEERIAALESIVSSPVASNGKAKA